MRKYTLALAALAVLGACTTASNDTLLATAPEATRALTYHHQLVRAAGLTNVPKAVANQRNAEIGTASGAGMAVTGALNGVGALSNIAAGGLGLLTFLSSPPAGPESWDHMIAELPPTASPEAFAGKVQQVYLKPLDRALRARGYVPQPAADMPGQIVYLAPGCGKKRSGMYDPDCSYIFAITLQPKASLGGKRVYLMTPAENAPMHGLNGSGLNAPLLRKAADAYPAEVSVYVAPRRVAEGWTPPMLYRQGKPHPL